MPAAEQNEIYASFAGETFRPIRFGVAEAHGQGSLMEFNFLSERGAIRRNAQSGLYEIDFARMPRAIDALAKELLEQEATGDRARTEAWFRKYAVMPPSLDRALKNIGDIPVDVDPEFDFHPALQ